MSGNCRIVWLYVICIILANSLAIVAIDSANNVVISTPLGQIQGSQGSNYQLFKGALVCLAGGFQQVPWKLQSLRNF